MGSPAAATIWKFSLGSIRGVVRVHMPRRAMLLRAAAFQGFDLVIWALVDPAQATEERDFVVCWTGWPLPTDAGGDWGYMGTATSPTGIVAHVFDVGDRQTATRNTIQECDRV